MKRYDVIIIDENPRATMNGFNNRYAYTDVEQVLPVEGEVRVFLDADKKFMGVGPHSRFPNAKWSRGLSHE